MSRISPNDNLTVYSEYKKVALLRNPYTSLVWSFIYMDSMNRIQKKMWRNKRINFKEYVNFVLSGKKPSSFKFMSDTCAICQITYDLYLQSESSVDMDAFWNAIYLPQWKVGYGSDDRGVFTGADGISFQWIPKNVIDTFYSWLTPNQSELLDNLFTLEMRLLNYSLTDRI